MIPTVEFDVPARAEYLGLVRMVVSSLAASRRELDDESLDDLRLAVSEACTMAVGGTRMKVVCWEEPSALVIDVGGARQRPGSTSPAVTTEALDPLSLVRALVDDVNVADGVVRMRVACPPAGL